MPRRRRRLVIAAATVVGVLLAGWIAFAVAVIGHPTLAANPGNVDAIVVLGPSNKRVAQATDLAARDGVDTVVLSIGDFAIQRQTTCSQPHLTVICFVPDPYTTAGEAARIGVLATAHHWRRIAVIAAKAQASRARWLIGRCFPGTVEMIAATNPESRPSAWGWVTQSVYQSAAWAKNLVTRSCTPAAGPSSQGGTAPI